MRYEDFHMGADRKWLQLVFPHVTSAAIAPATVAGYVQFFCLWKGMFANWLPPAQNAFKGKLARAHINKVHSILDIIDALCRDFPLFRNGDVMVKRLSQLLFCLPSYLKFPIFYFFFVLTEITGVFVSKKRGGALVYIFKWGVPVRMRFA
ncbi:hypothetical protein Holit_00761 [Hollandina sp. SP2]